MNALLLYSETPNVHTDALTRAFGDLRRAAGLSGAPAMMDTAMSPARG